MYHNVYHKLYHEYLQNPSVKSTDVRRKLLKKRSFVSETPLFSSTDCGTPDVLLSVRYDFSVHEFVPCAQFVKFLLKDSHNTYFRLLRFPAFFLLRFGGESLLESRFGALLCLLGFVPIRRDVTHPRIHLHGTSYRVDCVHCSG